MQRSGIEVAFTRINDNLFKTLTHKERLVKWNQTVMHQEGERIGTYQRTCD